MTDAMAAGELAARDAAWARWAAEVEAAAILAPATVRVLRAAFERGWSEARAFGAGAGGAA